MLEDRRKLGYLNSFHMAEVLRCAEKSISWAELWKRNFTKGCTKLFQEGIHTQLSALDRFKLDLVLDQGAVCEGLRLYIQHLICALTSANSFSTPSWLTNTPGDC